MSERDADALPWPAESYKRITGSAPVFDAAEGCWLHGDVGSLTGSELDAATVLLGLLHDVAPDGAERAMPPGWDSYITDAVDIEWCTSRSYKPLVPETPESHFYKRQAVDRGLIDGRIVVRVDATLVGVEVPKRHRNTRDLRLAMTLNDPVDTTTDAAGLRSSLSFEGRKYECVLPWAAIWAVATERGVSCWREDMPPEALDLLDAPIAAKTTVPPPPPYVPDPTIGPAVDSLMAFAAPVLSAKRAADIAAWEQAEGTDATPVCAYTGYRVQRATERPAAEETVALLACERKHLGVDRLAGTIVDPRALDAGGGE